ncbi:hypothetical protein [Spirosoma panaciterrae]|nr:hypothetical protein [Spirosoma panaciterrae]
MEHKIQFVFNLYDIRENSVRYGNTIWYRTEAMNPFAATVN